MKFGINTFLFASPFTTESVSLFPMFKEWGFDSVEIALEDASHIDPVAVKKALDDNGLICSTICAALGPGRDLRGSEEDQQNALEYMKGVLDVMPTLGCKSLIGPLYSAVGRAEYTPEEDYQQQWVLAVKNLKILAAHAEKLGLRLGIEPLNRYETDFINTCDQALKLIAEIDNPAAFVHLDTFHMNIEEKDPAKAILKAGDKLTLLHASGSDRGTPGGDQINWDKIAAALKEINFDGDVVIESFTPEVKIIAKAASIWRPMEPSKEDIAVEGIKFLKNKLA